jgi:membrane-bound lytic murein transglycosylase D
MKTMKLATFLVVLLGTAVVYSQEKTSNTDFEITPDDPVIQALDKLYTLPYFEKNRLVTDTSKLNKYKFPSDSVPVYNDEIYRARLEKLDAATPFSLTYNQHVKGFIHLYAVKKRELTSRVLGMSSVYFPLFEEVLDKYDMPLEFKYLAVVESALNPVAKSRSGAMGLWQFMYRTGLIYDLKVTSYIDDRCDPYKSTVAACLYLKYLYGLYGNYELAMAAYNCGPGNVNRAIRRSGGKKDYWELWPYLPQETRGYVPAFIAVNYIMNYATEHNLYPVAPVKTYYEYDTVKVSNEVSFEQLSKTLEIPLEVVEYLNPSYKKQLVPKTDQQMVVSIPRNKIGLFIQNEELVYNYGKTESETENAAEENFVLKEVRRSHIVKKGEYLGAIAEKYNCSVNDIKAWNDLRSAQIQPGQKLTVYVSTKIVQPTENITEKINSEQKDDGKATFYTIQDGDTLFSIAKKQGITVADIEQLNKNIDVKNLKPGSKIVVSCNC